MKPDAVESAFEGEEIRAQVPISDEKELYVTPTQAIIYKPKKESINKYIHTSKALEIIDSGSRTKISIDRPINTPKEISTGYKNAEDLLKEITNKTITHPGSVNYISWFNHQTFVITNDRIIIHEGVKTWDTDYDEYLYDDLIDIGLDEDEGEAIFNLEDENKNERIVASKSENQAFIEWFKQTLIEFYDTQSFASLCGQIETREPAVDTTNPDKKSGKSSTESSAYGKEHVTNRIGYSNEQSSESYLDDTVSDASIEELIDESERLAEQAETSPESVASELPLLVEMIQISGLGDQHSLLSLNVGDAIIQIAEHDPALLEEQYPEIIEALLDSTERRVISRSLLHEIAEYVRLGVSPQRIHDAALESFDKIESAIVELSDMISETRDIDERLPDGGATMIHLHEHLTDVSDIVSGREQLLVESWATVTKRLAQYYAKSAGVDPIDGFVDLQSRYESSDQPFVKGFNSDGEIVNMIETGGSSLYQVYRHFLEAAIACALITLVERTHPQILKTEAIIAERIR